MPDLTKEDTALLDGHPQAIAGELLAERRRQMDGEGFTPKHDERHPAWMLAAAAAAYCMACLARHIAVVSAEVVWPWDLRDFKPKDDRRDLVRAGALVVAAIERCDRETARLADVEAG